LYYIILYIMISAPSYTSNILTSFGYKEKVAIKFKFIRNRKL